MGAVYQAWDAELGVAVAVKVIRPEIASNPEASAEIERRFKRELLLARQVTHPNVVRIHDLGDINGIKYITMPLIEGSDLSTILDEHKTLPVRRALHIARGVVAGLVSAHEAGVVHRDLKPANIMIGVDDVPTIMDFGIARSADSPQQASVTPHGVRPTDLSRTAGLSASATQAGAIVGTVAYMAPEQASGKPVDQRADIYAFGLILYDMLVGGRRRERAQSAVAELVERMQTAPPAPRTIDPTIPEAVDAIVRRCVEPDPAKRFQKTVDLNAAFERLDDDGEPLPMIRRLTRQRRGAVGRRGVAAHRRNILRGPVAIRPTVVRAPISVLVADFNNQTGDAVFDNAVEQALTMGIEGASFIRAYPRGNAQEVARILELPSGPRIDENAALLVARREDIKLILAGSIAAAGSGYSLTVRAVNPTAEAGQSEVASASAQAATKDEVLAAVASLAADLRRDLGDTDEEIAKTAAADSFTTNSMEAMQAYGLAQQMQATGRRAESLEAFTRAIKHDPQFGLAYSGAAVASNALGRTT